MKRFCIGLAALAMVVAWPGCALDQAHFERTLTGPGTPHPALAMKPVPEGLGVNIHFYKGNAKDWAMLSEAGVGIVRMDISWAGAEKKPGEYDFSHYDTLVGQLQQHHMRVIFILDYGNPLYDDGLSPHTDAGRAAYARFASALAAHFAGKPVIWELWNEPNISFWKPSPNVGDYMAWCKAVVPAIRKADPNACIIGPASSRIDIKFLRGCFQRGLLKLVDGVSVHPYRGSKNPPETAVREYKRLANMIAQYKPKHRAGTVIPILSGEWGYTTAGVSRETQGKYLPRQWLTNMAYGLPISIWYDWHDDGKDPKEREHNFGTVTWDYKPKPAYTAMKTLIAQLGGYTAVGRLDTDKDDDYVVTLRKGGSVILACWTLGDAHTIDLGHEVHVIKAVNYLGKDATVPEDGKVALSDGPVYLTLRAPYPKWLK